MKEHTIGLTEIAHLAQNRMKKEKEYIEGVKFAMHTMPKTYDGTYTECARYINHKLENASFNAVISPQLTADDPMLYIGCIALYASMNEILLEKASKK